MAQIEPIEVSSCKNKGVCLKVYFSLSSDDKLRGEVLDSFDNVLFTRVVTAKTIEDVAEKLGLTINNK